MVSLKGVPLLECSEISVTQPWIGWPATVE
jgi:hypothetical protein